MNVENANTVAKENNNIVSVKAQKRDGAGSKFCEKLRGQGLIPAKIDRSDIENITVEEAFLLKLY